MRTKQCITCGADFQVPRSSKARNCSVCRVPPARGLKSSARLDKEIELYRGGLSIRRIGERFGVAHTTVWDDLKRAGEPIRNYDIFDDYYC